MKLTRFLPHSRLLLKKLQSQLDFYGMVFFLDNLLLNVILIKYSSSIKESLL